jgi:hypothetical protein
MTSHSRSRIHPTDQWQSLVGEFVEIRLEGEVYRQGWVDAAMPDASGLWIAPEAVFQREFIDAASGFEVWTSLYPTSPWAGPPLEMAEAEAKAHEQVEHV